MRRDILFTAAAAAIVGAGPAIAETVTIATVNNSDMIVMQKLSPQWEQATGNTLNWVVLEENVLRQRVTTDIATDGGQFDVMTIGTYEVPIWAAQGWLEPVNDLGDEYDIEDVLAPVRDGLSYEGTLYALPFYAESSMMFYRADLFEEAGIEVPEQPTWQDVRGWAETTPWGTVKADPITYATNEPGVFAAGDIVRGASLVVWAIREGREAADAMHAYIQSRAKAAAE